MANGAKCVHHEFAGGWGWRKFAGTFCGEGAKMYEDVNEAEEMEEHAENTELAFEPVLPVEMAGCINWTQE